MRATVFILALMLLFAAVPAVKAQAGFYVAIAPYLTTTHPCKFHAKGSCQGELRLVALHYSLRSTDGTVTRTGTVRTGSDGFLEWWLPQGKNYVVTFGFGAREGTGTFSSFSGDATCITTIQLK